MGVRATGWDHATLPYTPHTPCILFYLVPGDPVWRVVVPNSRGAYYHLVPGLPYREYTALRPSNLLEHAPPPFMRDVATEMDGEG
ncbi:hypothetical protein STCU_01072 [Strigomonas culicis]|uniref:Uncharacterized protein n=1 Tax=Strigomonas culicis TaxID=28005 RepID=S9UXM5_9TRYP|nr:hypothetical protein STCU_01072 [Strigomonas culicis]|eukprot:EPY35602.1 hypothetical protein STCU_01072 [Strigomonas culicis]